MVDEAAVMFIKANGARKPEPVSVSWERIEAWTADHLPGSAWRPGLAKETLDEFEAIIGKKLPDDLRESLRIHDGQESYSVGLFFGLRIFPLMEGEVDSSLSFWHHWNRVREGLDAESLGLIESDQSSVPSGAIQPRYVEQGWIAFSLFHTTDHIGVDLSPGPSGHSGQVINFGRDSEEKYVLARSWAHFLDDIAGEMEAGNHVIAELEGWDPCFTFKNPPKTFDYVIPEWSKAKNGKKRTGR